MTLPDRRGRRQTRPWEAVAKYWLDLSSQDSKSILRPEPNELLEQEFVMGRDDSVEDLGPVCS